MVGDSAESLQVQCREYKKGISFQDRALQLKQLRGFSLEEVVLKLWILTH